MSNVCLAVTAKIRELADSIRRKYPDACRRNGFSDIMCAEWVGAYYSANNIEDLDSVPSEKSIISFVEKERNKEGKSFLRDLLGEEVQELEEDNTNNSIASGGLTVTYTSDRNSPTQTLTVRGPHIFNQNGVEVFPANDRASAADRLKVYANLAVKQRRAVVVSYRNHKYVVNEKGAIIDENGNRVLNDAVNRDEIIALAVPKLASIRQRGRENQNTIAREDIARQLKDYFTEMGIMYTDEEAMFMLRAREKGLSVQQIRKALEEGNLQMMEEDNNKPNETFINKLKEYESRLRRNAEALGVRRQAADGGLLKESQTRIQRRDGNLRETQEQGVQSQELINKRNREDEAALEKFAKEQGHWLDNADETLEKQYGKRIGHGAESFVYRKNANTVIKSRTIDPNVEGGYKTYQEALESIAIHNKLFPETAMTITGFGRSEGEFCVIIEQPYIEGNFATPDEIQQFITGRFGKDTVKDEDAEGKHNYKNPIHLLQDLKPKNVIVKKVNGKDTLFVIDGDFYNTQEYQNYLDAQQSSQTGNITGFWGNSITPETENNTGKKNLSSEDDEFQDMVSSDGKTRIYGFALGDKFWTDLSEVNPETYLHENTHLWDKVIAKQNPRLWKKGVQIMRSAKLKAEGSDISIWQWVEQNPLYGMSRKWQAFKNSKNPKDRAHYEFLVASEVHARLVGREGQEILSQLAETKGAKGIVAKFKQWLADFYKALVRHLPTAFRHWTDSEIDALTWEDFRNMTLRDIMEGAHRTDFSQTQTATQMSQETSGETYTPEMIAIKQAAEKNGTFMKAHNGKDTHLTERQWLQVRTQAFKKWFGDWENDPANASKVVDENGEPLVVYHGSTNGNFTVFNNSEAKEKQSKSVDNAFFFTSDRDAADSYGSKREFFLNIRNPHIYDFEGRSWRNQDWSGIVVSYDRYSEILGTFNSVEEAEAFREKFLKENPDYAEDADYVNVRTGVYQGDVGPDTDQQVKQAQQEGKDGAIFNNVVDYGMQNQFADFDTETPPINDFVAFGPNQIKSATDNIGTFSTENDDIQMMMGKNQKNNSNFVNENKNSLNDFINGKTKFNNLTEEENDVARRDRILAEAGIQVRRNGRTGQEESQDERNERQEEQVTQWAKQEGIWHEDAIAFGQSFGEELPGGNESHVYENTKNGTVVKVKNTLQYHNLLEFLDGIILHNTLFPETAYKVLGFGNDGEGFVVILEQPFVRGIEPTQQQIDDFIKEIQPDAEKYEEELKNGRYRTPQTLIHDISPRNAVLTPGGNIAVIDGIIRPNVPSEGKGGQRSEDYSIVPSTAENYEYNATDSEDDDFQFMAEDNSQPAPKPTTPKGETVKRLLTWNRWQKQHIVVDKKAHVYYIDGKPADYSVTQYMEKVYGKPDIHGDYAFAQEMGNAVDALTRDFFNHIFNRGDDPAEKAYKNLSEKRKNEILGNLKKLKEQFDKEFVGKDGKPDYRVITSEIPLAATIIDDGEVKKIAGTPDMLIVDSEGNIHILDMKVKSNSIDDWNNRRDYTFQLNAYRQIIEATFPELKGKIKDLRLIWFNTAYPKQGKGAWYSTDEQGIVTVTDNNVRNTSLAGYYAWQTPSLRANVSESLLPLRVEDHLKGTQPIVDLNNTAPQQPSRSSGIDVKKISTKTADYGVVISKNLKDNWEAWKRKNPYGIVAYRVHWNRFNSPEEARNGIIGNPFTASEYGEEKAGQLFADWLVTGNNFGNIKATEEYRQAIIDKILRSPEDAPTLYYKELDRPSHATIIGYLIRNKHLLKDAVSPSNISPDDFVMHSGGAVGSDSMWEEIGRLFGIRSFKHYYLNDPTRQKPARANTLMSEKDREEAVRMATQAAARNYGFNYTISDPLVLRDWAQVKYADAVFAVGKILAPGQKLSGKKGDDRVAQRPMVDGGTGYAVGMAIDAHKPVYVYNTGDNQWYTWNGRNAFVVTETPTLTPNFAGIGTRELGALGLEAIKAVYEKTFGRKVEMPQELTKELGKAFKLDLGSVFDETEKRDKIDFDESQFKELGGMESKPTREKSDKLIPRPESGAFDSALKEVDEKEQEFLATFTSQQLNDRQKMIADYFGQIIGEFIWDKRDACEEAIQNAETEEEREEAKAALAQWKDPVLSKLAALEMMTYDGVMAQVREKIENEYQYIEDEEKRAAYDNLLKYFDRLAEGAAWWIEEFEGIPSKNREKTRQDEIEEEADNEDNEEGVESTGNDGWSFVYNQKNPWNTVSKRLKHSILAKLPMQDKNKELVLDDIGTPRTYSPRYIYACTIAYMAENMRSVDDFMQKVMPKDYKPGMKDLWGDDITEELYPYGYPSFPILKKMQLKYPWAKDIETRLVEDWRSDGVYTGTGILSSEFYTNFHTAFWSYGRIDMVNTEEKTKFGIIPMNYLMDEEGMIKEVEANYNNGVPLNEDSLYNQDKTLNKEHAKVVKEKIKEERQHIKKLYSIMRAEQVEGKRFTEEEQAFVNDRLEKLQHILQAVGMNVEIQQVASSVLHEDEGLAMDTLLSRIDDLIGAIESEKDITKNYFDLRTQASKNRKDSIFNPWKKMFQNVGFVSESNMVASCYDKSTQKNYYSYAPYNRVMEVFGWLSQRTKAQGKDAREYERKRKQFLDEEFGQYEYYRDQSAPKGQGWKFSWLRDLYAGALSTDPATLTILSVTDLGGARPYTDWTPDDIDIVMMRGYDKGGNKEGFFMVPIFSDGSQCMLVRGPKHSQDVAVIDDLLPVLGTEMARMNYVGEERERLIKEGTIMPIDNYEENGLKFNFIPELNYGISIAYKNLEGKTVRVSMPIKQGKEYVENPDIDLIAKSVKLTEKGYEVLLTKPNGMGYGTVLLDINTFEGIAVKDESGEYVTDNLEDYLDPEHGTSLLDRLHRARELDSMGIMPAGWLTNESEKIQRNCLWAVLEKRADEWIKGLSQEAKTVNGERLGYLELRDRYFDMVNASVNIVALTSVDPAFFKNYSDYQKRNKQNLSNGPRLNTKSRLGTEKSRVVTIKAEMRTSSAYANIKKTAERGLKEGRLSQREVDRLLKSYAFMGKGTGIDQANAQALRSMHSMISMLDMKGVLTPAMEDSFERIKNGNWTMKDFDVIYQTLKPFVYALLKENDFSPVPVQHKNSEIALLTMYSLISAGTAQSARLRGISRFMETARDSEGNYLVDMIQDENAVKCGNKGVINLNFSREKVAKASEELVNAEESGKVFELSLDDGTKISMKISKADLQQLNGRERADQRVDKLSKNYNLILSTLTRMLHDEKISQETFNKAVDYFQPSEDEVVQYLNEGCTVADEQGNVSINTETVREIPNKAMMEAQPTPPHHMDARIPQGSQKTNLITADLSPEFSLTLESKGVKKEMKRDELIDFYQSLIIEDLLGEYAELKKLFGNKKKLSERLGEIAESSPTFGKGFSEALEINEDGEFSLPLDSPVLFHQINKLVNSMIRNAVTAQKKPGAALIQAAGIGLTDKLKLVYDENDNLVGAQCLLPATSKKFFEPLMKEKTINGKKVKILDEEALKAAGLDKALGYRIPTENKSSMLPIIIEGFSPQQNGSTIFLPAEITSLSGSDFDVDKLYVLLSSFRVVEYDMKKARSAYYEKFPEASVSAEELADMDLELGETEYDVKPHEIRTYPKFGEWWSKLSEEDRNKYKLSKPKLEIIEYDFNKAPENNSKKARANMLLKIQYGILTSQEGAEQFINPQHFQDVKAVAKTAVILRDDNLFESFKERVEKLEGKKLSDDEVIQLIVDRKYDDEAIDVVENQESFLSPSYPETFKFYHKQNMAGRQILAIFALQVSAAAKFQRANITIKKSGRFKIDGYEVTNAHGLFNSIGEHRLKSVSQFVGASADNGKDANVADFGITKENANMVAYMLRAGLSIDQAMLLLNQPEMGMSAYAIKKKYTDKDRNVLLKLDMSAEPVDLNSVKLAKRMREFNKKKTFEDDVDIASVIYHLKIQSKMVGALTSLSRADSPKGGLQESFARSRIRRYKIEKLWQDMRSMDSPFEIVGEAVENVPDLRGKSIEELRKFFRSKKMGMLQAFHTLGIQSLEAFLEPEMEIFSEEFDKYVVTEILDTMSPYTSDDDLEKIIDAAYRDFVTYKLSESPLFGREEKDGKVITIRDKMEYYLGQFPAEYSMIIKNNKRIYELVGRYITNEKGRLVSNIERFSADRKKEVSSQIEQLEGQGAAGAKLLEDLILYSFYDNGLTFKVGCYNRSIPVSFLRRMPGYTETLRNKKHGREFYENFLRQFYNKKRFGVEIKGALKKSGDTYVVENASTSRLNVINRYTGKPYRYIIESQTSPRGDVRTNLELVSWDPDSDIAVYKEPVLYNGGAYDASSSVEEMAEMFKAPMKYLTLADYISLSGKQTSQDAFESLTDEDALGRGRGDYKYAEGIEDISPIDETTEEEIPISYGTEGDEAFNSGEMEGVDEFATQSGGLSIEDELAGLENFDPEEARRELEKQRSEESGPTAEDMDDIDDFQYLIDDVDEDRVENDAFASTLPEFREEVISEERPADIGQDNTIAEKYMSEGNEQLEDEMC